MKYKVDDTVKIKSWQNMKNTYGGCDNNLTCEILFTKTMEKEINKSHHNRTLTIKEIKRKEGQKGYGYIMKDFKGYGYTKHLEYVHEWMFTDDMIEHEIILEPINSRYEILDL